MKMDSGKQFQLLSVVANLQSVLDNWGKNVLAVTYLCWWPVSDGEMSTGPFPPLGLNYTAALPTATRRHFSNSFPHRSPPQSKGRRPLTGCCSPPLIQKDASQLQSNHQGRLWYRCIIRNESSFMGRKERQEACVALKFQGSKNKLGAWIPMAVDGRALVAGSAPQIHQPELFLGCRLEPGLQTANTSSC